MRSKTSLLLIGVTLTILAGWVFLRYDYSISAERAQTSAILKILEDAILEYERELDVYPEGNPSRQLRELQGDNLKKKVYLKLHPQDLDPASEMPKDGWSHPLIFKVTTNQFACYSLGLNGRDEGGAGDDLGFVCHEH